MKRNLFPSVRSRESCNARRRIVFPLPGLIALALVAATAFAYALDQPTAPSTAKTVVVPLPPVRTLNVQVWTDQSTYTVGDDVSVHFKVDKDARVYIFDTDASGRTTQLFPNGHDQNNFVQGGVEYAIPDSTYRLVATGPVGWESLHIVAYGSPAIYFPEYQSFPDPTHPFPLRPEGAIPILDKLENGEGWGVRVPANSTAPPAAGTDSSTAPSVTAPPPPAGSGEGTTNANATNAPAAPNTEKNANTSGSQPPATEENTTAVAPPSAQPPQPQGTTPMTVIPRPLQYGDDQTQFYVGPVVSYSTPYTETYPYYSLYPDYYPLYTYPYYTYGYPGYGEYRYRGHEHFGHSYGFRPRGYEYRGYRSNNFRSGTRDFHSGTRNFYSGTRQFHSGTREFHASPGRGSFGQGDFNRGSRQGIESRGSGSWGSRGGGESHFGGGSHGGSRGGGARGGRR